MAGSCLALLAKMAELPAAGKQLFVAADGGAANLRLLLHVLWRWRGDWEAMESLLYLFERAMAFPCHRTLLALELRPHDSGDDRRRCLPELLRAAADALCAAQRSEGRLRAAARARRLAAEWAALRAALGLAEPGLAGG